ncbi:tbpA [Symbiodinium sp. KB8]|nr:tbpA [Symbiodinium sp. KB8]
MQLRGQKLSAAGTARDGLGKDVHRETENDRQPYLCMYYPWLPQCMHPQINYAPPRMPPMYPMYNPTYNPVPHYAPIPAPYFRPPTAPVPSMPTYQPPQPPQPMPASTRLARRGGLDPPTGVKTHNGASWETMRISGTDTKHIFALGDWGSLLGIGSGAPKAIIQYKGGHTPGPHTMARHRGPGCSTKEMSDCFGATAVCPTNCHFKAEIDLHAQTLVATQMKKRAPESNPDFVLNVGDNFYWGGIETECGHPMSQIHPQTHAQFKVIFEDIYNGPGLDGKPWLSVFGNHDLGGFQFNKAWDQQIAYTFASDRWRLPAMYWMQRVELVAPARYRRVHLADADDTAVQVKEEWHLTGHLRLSQAQRSPDVVMVPETGPDGDDEELLTPRSDSQRKQTALAEGWTRVNQGGNGDCASKDPSPDTLKDFKEWLDTMSDPRAWADGIILQAKEPLGSATPSVHSIGSFAGKRPLVARNLASVAGDPVALSQAGHLGDDEVRQTHMNSAHKGAVSGRLETDQSWVCAYCARAKVTLLRNRRHSQCRQEERASNLRSTGVRALWWKAETGLQGALTKLWRLNSDERHSFTLKKDTLRKYAGRTNTVSGEAPSVRRDRLVKQRRSDKYANRFKNLAEYSKTKLVRDGVEPNPGPSLRCLSLNCGSGRASFGFIATLSIIARQHRPDVIALQETFWKTPEVQRVRSRLHGLGYRLWRTDVESSNGQTRGGVALAAKVSLPAEFVMKHSDADGQALTARVGGVYVTSLHRRPTGEGQGLLLGYLNDAATVAAVRQSDTVRVFGDHKAVEFLFQGRLNRFWPRRMTFAPSIPDAIEALRSFWCDIWKDLYRLLMSGLLQQDAMKHWLTATAHPCCHGALSQRSVTTALASLVPELTVGSPALALDYQKCFDHVNPGTVLKLLRQDPPYLKEIRLALWLWCFSLTRLPPTLRGLAYGRQGNGGDTSLKKFHVSKLLAAPLARANVGVDVRRKLFATRTIPKVSFGWWLLPFQDRQRSAFFQLYRLVGAVQRQSAVGLRPILDGHAKCPQFRAVAQAVTELGTAARAGLTWSQPLNAWASTVSSQLTRWGFRLEGALEVAAFFGLTLRRVESICDMDLKVHRILRESLRRMANFSITELKQPETQRDSELLNLGTLNGLEEEDFPRINNKSWRLCRTLREWGDTLERAMAGFHRLCFPALVWSVLRTYIRFNARCELDLKQIAFGIRHAEYNPRKHSSITVRLFNPRVTALIRASGAITLSANAGCASEDDLKRSAKKLARLIQRCGHDGAKFADFAVTSILCKATLGFPVRLDVLASRFRKNALYEPEFFCSCASGLQVAFLSFPRLSFLPATGQGISHTTVRFLQPPVLCGGETEWEPEAFCSVLPSRYTLHEPIDELLHGKGQPW